MRLLSFECMDIFYENNTWSVDHKDGSMGMRWMHEFGQNVWKIMLYHR